jgi:hypothetical protein
MHRSTKNILVDLIISYHETSGQPVIAEDDRNELVRHLTHVLCNPATLKRHTATLIEELKFKSASPMKFDRAILGIFLTKGLDAMTSNFLALVSLNSETLSFLQQTIEREKPDGWKKALRAEGMLPTGLKGSSAGSS